MRNDSKTFLTGCILEEDHALTLGDLCRACAVHAEHIIELVEEGVIEPEGREPAQWRFAGVSLRRARVALHLQHDLGINPAGSAMILDLMAELDALRKQLNRMP